MSEPQQITDIVAQLGESPAWDAQQQTLSWLDISNRRLHRYDPSTGGVASSNLSQVVTAVAPSSGTDLVAACGAGFGFVDPSSGVVRRVGPDLVENSQDRMNDGACDPDGRFWAGSMVSTRRAGTGALWVLDTRLRVRIVLDGVTVSNGLGWSPDGSIVYYIDTYARCVDALELGPNRLTVRSRRPLIEFSNDRWLPDGLAVDREGYLWVAIWGGARIQRYAPDGRLDLEVELPARHVTSCAFGGEDLSDLYVTSARDGVAAEEIAREPANGGLFRVRAPVPGLPVAPFAGACQGGDR